MKKSPSSEPLLFALREGEVPTIKQEAARLLVQIALKGAQLSKEYKVPEHIAKGVTIAPEDEQKARESINQLLGGAHMRRVHMSYEQGQLQIDPKSIQTLNLDKAEEVISSHAEQGSQMADDLKLLQRRRQNPDLDLGLQMFNSLV